jgi:hypothetical protein
MNCDTPKHLYDVEVSIARFKSTLQYGIFILTSYEVKDPYIEANAKIVRYLCYRVSEAKYAIHELEKSRDMVSQHVDCNLLEADDCLGIRDHLIQAVMDADLHRIFFDQICLNPIQICRHAEIEEISMLAQDEWVCVLDIDVAEIEEISTLAQDEWVCVLDIDLV